MKRIAQLITLIIPFCGLVTSALTSCNDNKNTESAVITVKDPLDKDFPVSDYFKVDKTVYVSAEGEYFLAYINDVFVTDKYAFLFDGQQRISKVDLSTGQIVSQLNRRGRGPEEYIMAIGIAGDDEHIYLLDRGAGNTIHVYDHNFNHQYKFNIDWPTSPSTFISLGNGFVFQNGSENDSIGKFVFTDNQGRITKSFLEKKKESPNSTQTVQVHTESGWSEEEFVVVHYEELFNKDSQGNILCFNPNTYESYLYNGKSMIKQFQIKMEDGMPDQPKPSIGKVFYPDGKILVNYFYNKRGAYNRFGNMAIFDKDYNLIVEGVGGQREGEAPFLPMLQKGNQLITVQTTDDAVGAVVPGKSIQAEIVFHSLK
ncbi:MAG: 6-bladed beta-propeller [Bacteroidaceae bacterium]|nr:6-bladed beta-propeller [Bacteroidaceae bacterium]MBR5707561.1 6-bladed beta-propeller [Bacteroidaceae bacterium]